MFQSRYLPFQQQPHDFNTFRTLTFYIVQKLCCEMSNIIEGLSSVGPCNAHEIRFAAREWCGSAEALGTPPSCYESEAESDLSRGEGRELGPCVHIILSLNCPKDLKKSRGFVALDNLIFRNDFCKEMHETLT